MIVGFPGETDAEFGELLEFLDEVQLERVGAFTYAAYIWHWPVEALALRLGYDPLALHAAFGIRIVGQLVYWATLFVASVGMGALSWYALEVHCLKLKRFFSYGGGTVRRARSGGDE